MLTSVYVSALFIYNIITCHSISSHSQQESCVVASLPNECEERNMDKEKDEVDNENTDSTINNTVDVAAVNDDDSEVILNFHCQDSTKVDGNEADVTTEIDNNSNAEEVGKLSMLVRSNGISASSMSTCVV